MSYTLHLGGFWTFTKNKCNIKYIFFALILSVYFNREMRSSPWPLVAYISYSYGFITASERPWPFNVTHIDLTLTLQFCIVFCNSKHRHQKHDQIFVTNRCQFLKSCINEFLFNLTCQSIYMGCFLFFTKNWLIFHSHRPAFGHIEEIAWCILIFLA